MCNTLNFISTTSGTELDDDDVDVVVVVDDDDVVQGCPKLPKTTLQNRRSDDEGAMLIYSHSREY